MFNIDSALVSIARNSGIYTPRKKPEEGGLQKGHRECR